MSDPTLGVSKPLAAAFRFAAPIACGSLSTLVPK